MIDIGFIHALDEEERIYNEYNEDITVIESIQYDLFTLNNRIENFELFESWRNDSNIDEYISEAVVDVVKKLGDAILVIIEKCKNFINEQIKKFQEYKFKHTSTEKKLDALAQKRPDLAEKVQIAVSSGALTLNDFKSMKDYMNGIDDLLKEVERGSVDEKSLKGRLNTLGDKLVKGSEVVIKVGAVAGAVTAVIKGYREIKSLSKKCDDEYAHASTAMLNKIGDYQDQIRVIDSILNNPDIDPKYASKLSMKQQVLAEAAKNYKGHLNGWMKLKATIFNKTDSLLSKLVKSANRSSDDLKQYRDEISTSIDGIKDSLDKLNEGKANRVANRKELIEKTGKAYYTVKNQKKGGNS